MATTPLKRKVPAAAARAAGWLAASVVAVIVLVLVVHVLITPVSPAQAKPAGHFGGPCWLCHFVSEGVDVVPAD